MHRTCLLVWTTLSRLLACTITYKLSLQATPDYASRMNERGPCSTFPYQNTYPVEMPVKAPNLQFWMTGLLNERMTGQKHSFSPNLYRTSSLTCLPCNL
jgi:hypothetical protein